MFSPDIAKYAALCRKSKMREYRYQQQVYYGNLLKEILVNRQVFNLINMDGVILLSQRVLTYCFRHFTLLYISILSEYG